MPVRTKSRKRTNLKSTHVRKRQNISSHHHNSWDVSSHRHRIDERPADTAAGSECIAFVFLIRLLREVVRDFILQCTVIFSSSRQCWRFIACGASKIIFRILVTVSLCLSPSRRAESRHHHHHLIFAFVHSFTIRCTVKILWILRWRFAWFDRNFSRSEPSQAKAILPFTILVIGSWFVRSVVAELSVKPTWIWLAWISDCVFSNNEEDEWMGE